MAEPKKNRLKRETNTASTYARIYKTVKRIPKGRVATYGQIALLAGLPGHARQVGYALNVLSDDSSVPWHRVLNAKGEISRRAFPEYEAVQRLLLEGEGVRFNPQGRVSLRQFGWSPRRLTVGREAARAARMAKPQHRRQ